MFDQLCVVCFHFKPKVQIYEAEKGMINSIKTQNTHN